MSKKRSGEKEVEKTKKSKKTSSSSSTTAKTTGGFTKAQLKTLNSLKKTVSDLQKKLEKTLEGH
jgi:hypothetical protein